MNQVGDVTQKQHCYHILAFFTSIFTTSNHMGNCTYVKQQNNYKIQKYAANMAKIPTQSIRNPPSTKMCVMSFVARIYCRKQNKNNNLQEC